MATPVRWIPARIGLWLALLAAPVALAATPEELEAKFASANAKLDAGEHRAAIDLYNEILEAEPRAGNVWINRAIAKWNLKDVSGARADLAQALALDADNVGAYRVRASLRFQSGDLRGSLADVDAALQRVDDDAELHGMRGEVLRGLGDNNGALNALDAAIRLDGDYVAARFLRAQLLEGEQSPDAALADYNRVLELEPKHADARNNRGWIRFHRLDWDGAIADARAVLELAPQAAIAERLRGYAEFGRGNYEAAAAALAQATELAKDDPEQAAFALFVRHHALLRLGKPDKRLATTWGHWQDDWLKGLARFIVGQIDEDALENLVQSATDADEKAGRACEAHFYVGLARLHAGDKSTARLRFRSAVSTDKNTFVEHALAQAELKRL